MVGSPTRRTIRGSRPDQAIDGDRSRLAWIPAQNELGHDIDQHAQPTLGEADSAVMRSTLILGMSILAALLAASAVDARPAADRPVGHAAAVCSDYTNQAAAQRAADTSDPDSDGIYCENLPCPCSVAAGSVDGTDTAPAPTKPKTSCTRTTTVQAISFSAAKYPNIRQHFRDALKAGWPKTLVLNRIGAKARRERLLAHVPGATGYDRDEYPPAFARGKGKGLTHGTNPIGWMANVELVPSRENRSHGSVMGLKLRRFCNGTKFRYIFY